MVGTKERAVTRPGGPMRVLLTTQPAYGHFRPMLAVADALRARGHEIRVGSAARFASVVEEHGYPMEVAGLDWLEGDHASIPIELRAPPGLTLPQFVAHQFVWMTAERLARDVIALAGRWRPDVIIHETTEFGGVLAAESIGVPSVGLQIASPSLITTEVRTELDRALADVRVRMGLGAADAADAAEAAGAADARPHPILCFAPPSLHDPAVPLPDGLESFGPPATTIATAPGWTDGSAGARPRSAGERPMVYATLGTVFSDPAYELPFFPAVLDALRDEPLDLVMSVGPIGDPEAFGPQPEHVRIARYVPQRAVLDRCRVVICHGGYGTLLDAIDAGVPLIVVPMGADQFINARTVQRLGLGLTIDEEELTPERVREAVQTVLRDPTYAARVRTVGDEWRALPGPDAAAIRIEDIVSAPGRTRVKPDAALRRLQDASNDNETPIEDAEGPSPG